MTNCKEAYKENWKKFKKSVGVELHRKSKPGFRRNESGLSFVSCPVSFSFPFPFFFPFPAKKKFSRYHFVRTLSKQHLTPKHGSKRDCTPPKNYAISVALTLSVTILDHPKGGSLKITVHIGMCLMVLSIAVFDAIEHLQTVDVLQRISRITEMGSTEYHTTTTVVWSDTVPDTACRMISLEYLMFISCLYSNYVRFPKFFFPACPQSLWRYKICKIAWLFERRVGVVVCSAACTLFREKCTCSKLVGVIR